MPKKKAPAGIQSISNFFPKKAKNNENETSDTLVVPSQPQINTPQVPTSSQRPIVPVSESASADTALDPAMVTNVQKLCKHATSALDYEDVNTAIAKLTQALDILNKLKSN